MKHVSKAESLFMNGCNCSQAVFAAFDDVLEMNREDMIKLASGFGGGMGGMRDKCGAFCGMIMVMSGLYGGYDVKDNAAKTAFYGELRELARRFEEICGSLDCRELMGLAKGVNPPPSERNEQYYKARPCIRLVSTAAGLLDEYIAHHPIEKKFDFDSVINRDDFGSCKWARRTAYEKEHDIMPMSIADMEFAVAPCVREAVVNAAQHGIYGYTDPTERLLKAVQGWMKRRHDLELSENEILTFTGVVPMLRVAIRALTNPGDGVIIQTPIYPPFADSVTLNGRRLENCPLLYDGERYEMDFEAIERACKKPDVKMITICSPHNPVGRVWTYEELKRLDDICASNGVIVISDEIHSDLILKGKHIPYLNVSKDSVVLTAPCKSFNVPGLKTAFGFIKNEEVREKINHQARVDGFENMSYFGHAATIAAYEGGEEWLDAALDYIKGNFKVLEAFIKEKMPLLKLIEPEGTYLAWVDFGKLGMDEVRLERFTRDEAHLFLDEGYIFGSDGAGFERFNLAMPRSELVKALDRLYEAYKNIQ